MAYLLPINISTPTNVIALWTNMLREFDCGTWPAPSNGIYHFRLTVAGKNANSSGHALAFDYIKLKPVAPEPLSRPRLSAASSPGEVILSWPINTAGFALEYATRVSSTWLPATPLPTAKVVTNTTEGENRLYRLHKDKSRL